MRWQAVLILTYGMDSALANRHTAQAPCKKSDPGFSLLHGKKA